MTKTTPIFGVIIGCENCGREMYLRHGSVGATCPACHTAYHVEIRHKYNSVKGAADNYSVSISNDGDE